MLSYHFHNSQHVHTYCFSEKAASTEPGDYIWCSSNIDQVPRLMKQFFIQFALCGEWIRVFIGERRAGLSIGVGIMYLIGKSSGCFFL